MYWSLIAYGAIPFGAFLTMLLISGWKLLIDLASMICSTPVKIQKVAVSLDLLMTGLFAIMALLQHSNFQRAETKLREGQSTLQNMDELQRNVAFAERNWWICMLALTVWGVAWRMKNLYSSGIVAVQTRQVRHGSLKGRLMWTGALLVCVLAADLPVCRLNYHMQIAAHITPTKTSLRTFGEKNSCNGVMLAGAQGNCAEFCRKARSLSDDRLWAVEWARRWHMLGNVAAKTFDGLRNVEQGQQRIEQLFQDKSCDRVLESVDKSNHMVNMACAAGAAVAVVGVLVSLQNILSAGDAPQAVEIPEPAGPVGSVLGERQASNVVPAAPRPGDTPVKPTAKKESVTD